MASRSKRYILAQVAGGTALLSVMLVSWFSGRAGQPLTEGGQFYRVRKAAAEGAKIKIYDLAGQDSKLAGVVKTDSGDIFDGGGFFDKRRGHLTATGGLRLPDQSRLNRMGAARQGLLGDLDAFSGSDLDSGHSGWGWLADDIKTSERRSPGVPLHAGADTGYRLLSDEPGGSRLGSGRLFGAGSDGFRSSQRDRLW